MVIRNTKKPPSNENKKVIGKFKDEMGGLPIVEWVGLRAKMYSILTKDGKEKKTGKGIKRSVLKKEIKHQQFKDCLFEQREYQHSMMNFRSECHQIYTIKQFKKSLSPFDDKRYILEDGYTTRAHGHYENGVPRPSKATEVSGLMHAMKGLTLMNTNELTRVASPLPTDNKFHTYIASLWK